MEEPITDVRRVLVSVWQGRRQIPEAMQQLNRLVGVNSPLLTPLLQEIAANSIPVNNVEKLIKEMVEKGEVGVLELVETVVEGRPESEPEREPEQAVPITPAVSPAPGREQLTLADLRETKEKILMQISSLQEELQVLNRAITIVERHQ